MLDLRHLQVFVAVADELHFGRAATRLDCSPSYVSQVIKALERTLGLPLFLRTSRKVELTGPGSRLVVTARSVLAALHDFDLQAAEIRSEPSRRLTVAYGPFTGHAVTELIHRFRSSHPHAEVDTRVATVSVDVSRMVAAGQVDIGIAQWAADGLARLPLRPPVDYVFLVPEHHRLYQSDRISFTDLDGEPLLCPPREQNEKNFDLMTEFWDALGVRPDFRYQPVTSIDQTYDFVAAGQGLGYTLPLRTPPAGTRFIPADGPRLPHRLYLIWDRSCRSPLLPAIRRTAAALFGTYPEDPAHHEVG